MNALRHTIRVVDSHTGGEPTRVVIEGGPDLGAGPMAERLSQFRERFDRFRSAIVNEPRGSDAMVGALLCAPVSPEAAAGVIFFNNVGYLQMCGHGTIGLVATLAYLGRIRPGTHTIETPPGTIEADLAEDGTVAIRNVPSYRLQANVAMDVPGVGRVSGDVAWGGNWFFLVNQHDRRLSLANLEELTDLTWKIRQELAKQGITGTGGAEIDHVELFSASDRPGIDSKNFVLCPGKAYDRSPCGTGTSAKLACLYADGKLRPGDVWKQESIVGSVFECGIDVVHGEVIPVIRGKAHISAEATLVLDDDDPFCWGIRP